MSQLADALMYAGIFYNRIDEVEDTGAVLSEDDFMHVAHAAAMQRMSRGQVATLEQIFKWYDKDSSGSIDFEEFCALLQEKIANSICVEEVMGVASLWGCDKLNVEMSLKDFLGIMSRVVKLHERYWHVLKGFQSSLGSGVK